MTAISSPWKSISNGYSPLNGYKFHSFHCKVSVLSGRISTDKMLKLLGRLAIFHIRVAEYETQLPPQQTVSKLYETAGDISRESIVVSYLGDMN